GFGGGAGVGLRELSVRAAHEFALHAVGGRGRGRFGRDRHADRARRRVELDGGSFTARGLRDFGHHIFRLAGLMGLTGLNRTYGTDAPLPSLSLYRPVAPSPRRPAALSPLPAANSRQTTYSISSACSSRSFNSASRRESRRFISGARRLTLRFESCESNISLVFSTISSTFLARSGSVRM